MNEQLDDTLIARARRAPRCDGPTLDERLAIRLLWSGEGDPNGRRIRVPVLMKVFQCGKNTIYANCLTGDAASYVAGRRAQEVKEIIASMGAKAARAKYVTPAIIRAVNLANQQIAEQNAA